MLYSILDSRRVIEPFCLVEQALNSRLITPVSTDSRELEALTPNHFLLGQLDTSFPSLLPMEHFDHKKRYVRVLSYAKAIWSRWLREYVRLLNTRVKWHTHPPIKRPQPKLAPVFPSSRGEDVATQILKKNINAYKKEQLAEWPKLQ